MTTMLGVVIDIPEPHSTVINRWREAIGDPQAGKIWPHVTLLPPTTVAKPDLAGIESHLAEVAQTVEPFSMRLAGTGTFRPISPVVFIQIARGVIECSALERAIRSGPLARELTFDYHPHVTVAHDVDDAALDDAYNGLSDFVARFTVERFTLFDRSHEGEWRQRRHYPLGAR